MNTATLLERLQLERLQRPEPRLPQLDPLGATSPPPSAPPSAGPIRRVAVCDDDLPFIRYVERALKLVDVEVTPITTLAQDEALRVLASSGADAALLDLHMYDDGDAGFRLVEAARANPATARMPLYLSTGDARAVQRNLALLQSHDCHLLLKPFGLDELLAALHLQHRTFAA